MRNLKHASIVQLLGFIDTKEVNMSFILVSSSLCSRRFRKAWGAKIGVTSWSIRILHKFGVPNMASSVTGLFLVSCFLFLFY
jgi:hypothetical protein